MALAPLGRRAGWTPEDLEALPDDGCRYEVVDGSLVVTPPASQRHQLRETALRDLLRAAAPPEWRCVTEWVLPLAPDTQRVADVAVFHWPPRDPRPDLRNPVGPRDVGLVVEVVSRSSRRTDRYAKPGDYAEAAIPLFWRLETAPALALHAFALAGSGYAEVARVLGRGPAPVPWGDVVVDLAALDS